MKTIATLILVLTTFTIFSQDKLSAYSHNKPKAEYKVGATKVTVWENQKEGEYGAYTELSFKVEKIYKKDDKWQSTNYYNLTELLQLRAAIDKAISQEAVKIDENEKKK